MTSIFELEDDSLVCEPVQVEGKTFYIRYLNGLEQDRFEQQWQNFKGSDSIVGIRGFMVAYCICDENGKPEFDSGNKNAADQAFKDAARKISKLQSQRLSPLFAKAMEINGWSSQDVEDLEKKS